MRCNAAKQELLVILTAEQRPKITSHFPFQRLPPEIRNTIYHLHLVQAVDFTRLRKWDDRLVARAQKAVRYKLHDPNYVPPLFEYTALSILGASCQLQNEALGIFYHHNTFRFKGVTGMRDFLRSIGPRRRAFVRDIRFYYNGKGSPAAFKLLATCENLTKLHIQVSVMTLWYSRRKCLLGAVGVSHLLKICGLRTVEFSQTSPLLNEEKKEGFEETVRKALLQPRKTVKEKKHAAKPKEASKRKNVAAVKKRTLKDGEAPEGKRKKLSSVGN